MEGHGKDSSSSAVISEVSNVFDVEGKTEEFLENKGIGDDATNDIEGIQETILTKKATVKLT